MKGQRQQPYYIHSYRKQPMQFLQILGLLLIAMGMMLLFICIPGWAWAAMAGAALVCAGWALISTCRR